MVATWRLQLLMGYAVKMPAAATKLAWSPDDRHLAIGSEKGAVYVLKCEA